MENRLNIESIENYIRRNFKKNKLIFNGGQCTKGYEAIWLWVGKPLNGKVIKIEEIDEKINYIKIKDKRFLIEKESDIRPAVEYGINFYSKDKQFYLFE